MSLLVRTAACGVIDLLNKTDLVDLAPKANDGTLRDGTFTLCRQAGSDSVTLKEDKGVEACKRWRSRGCSGLLGG